MTPPDTYARKSTAEKWLIRAGYEWAFIFIDEDTGTFSTVGSFGNWGYSWTSIGPRTLKEFLTGVEFDYFFGKVDDHNKGQEFSQEKSVQFLRERVLEYRRRNEIDKDHAAACWMGIDSLDEANGVDRLSRDLFAERVYDDHDLYRLLGGDIDLMEVRHPQCEGFWTKIWPVFLEATKPPIIVCDCNTNPNSTGCSAFGCRVQ